MIIDEVIIYSNATGIQKYLVGLHQLESAGIIIVKKYRYTSTVQNKKNFYGLQFIKLIIGNANYFLDYEDNFSLCKQEEIVVDPKIYFKRSLSNDKVLYKDYDFKILPLGPNERVLTDYSFKLYKELFRASLDQRNIKYSVATHSKIISSFTKHNNGIHLTDLNRNRRLTDFDNKKFVLFQTRLWVPENAKYKVEKERREYLNESRIRTLQYLKSEFGERFIGGALVDSDYSRKIVPKNLKLNKTNFNRGTYIRNLNNSIVAFASHGHHWPGISFVEFMRSGTVPFVDTWNCSQPFDIIDKIDYFSYDDTGAFVEDIEKILQNKTYALNLHQRALLNYHNKFSPESIVLYTLLKIKEMQ